MYSVQSLDISGLHVAPEVGGAPARGRFCHVWLGLASLSWDSQPQQASDVKLVGLYYWLFSLTWVSSSSPWC